MTINDRLKIAIKQKGYTLSAIAEKMQNERNGTIGISQPSLSEMLKGNIPFSRVEEIASIIGLSIPELMQIENNTLVITCPNCGTTYRLNPTVRGGEEIDKKS